MYNYAPQLLQLLFSDDITSLKINLKKVSPVYCEKTLYIIAKILKDCKTSKLEELVITGGHSGIHVYLSLIEDVCYFVRNRAINCQKLHLPIGSNDCIRSCSKMPRLYSLFVERTQHLNHKALMHLSDQKSFSRYGLKICHLGVFKHHSFNKLDVTEFIEKMVNLNSFSLIDEHRALVNQELIGTKVLTYSAIKLALTRSVFQAKSGGPSFECGLKELKVVDRQLKPQYVLETCPDLQKLYMDWQEELSEAPFEGMN